MYILLHMHSNVHAYTIIDLLESNLETSPNDTTCRIHKIILLWIQVAVYRIKLVFISVPPPTCIPYQLAQHHPSTHTRVSYRGGGAPWDPPPQFHTEGGGILTSNTDEITADHVYTTRACWGGGHPGIPPQHARVVYT